MALPNTGITTTLVGQTLGTSSRDVGTLCTHPNINKWSRFRPGYWYVTGTGINARMYFKVPDGVSTDQRQTGIPHRSKMYYHLGDFRSYNHSALQLRFSGAQDPIRTTKVVPGTQTIDNMFFFQVGEIDWRGTEIQENGQNMLGAAFPNPAEWLLVDNLQNIIARADVGTAIDERVEMYWTQDASVQNTKEVWLGIGYASTIKALFPEMYNKVTIQIMSQPIASILALSSLVTQAANQSGQSIYRIDINPASVSLLKNDTQMVRTFTFTGVDSVGTNYNIMASPNSRIYYDIDYKKDGVVTESSSNLYVNSPANMSLTIPFSHALDYDEQVDIKFRSFQLMIIQ